MNVFGILGKILFFQNIISFFISKLNPAVIHNIGKYYAIKKAFYLSALDHTKGDYYEFGVFTGSSFSHSIRCAKSNENIDKTLKDIKYFGFDSFNGFGELTEKEKHPFYTDINFKTNYKKVYNRITKLLNKNQFMLVKGYFDELSDKHPMSKYARIIFIDCDTFSSTQSALNFIYPSIQLGTIIILDDYFSYKGSDDKKGVFGAYKSFENNKNIKSRQIFNYGMGGVVKIIVKI